MQQRHRTDIINVAARCSHTKRTNVVRQRVTSLTDLFVAVDQVTCETFLVCHRHRRDVEDAINLLVRFGLCVSDAAAIPEIRVRQMYMYLATTCRIYDPLSDESIS